MRLSFVALLVFAMSGCAYIDWAGPWFGCPKGYIKKPATIGMFGTVKEPARCVPDALPNGMTEEDVKMKSDFQYCLENGLKESVNACMERKGWGPR